MVQAFEVQIDIEHIHFTSFLFFFKSGEVAGFVAQCYLHKSCFISGSVRCILLSFKLSKFYVQIKVITKCEGLKLSYVRPA